MLGFLLMAFFIRRGGSPASGVPTERIYETSPGLFVRERRNGRGERDGVQETWRDAVGSGTLLQEAMFQADQAQWSKEYWPNGNLRRVRGEDWLFRPIVREFDEQGRAVDAR